MRTTESRLRKIIRQTIVETYDGEGRPNWDNEEKLRKAGKFDKSNISKADEEQTAAELKYREDLRKDYERKVAEIEKMKQDRNARKKGERYRFDESFSVYSERGKYIESSDGSLLQLASMDEPMIIVSNGRERGSLVLHRDGRIYFQTNRRDQFFSNLQDLCDYLNQNGFEYEGIDDY